jgi:hypothetical protein
MNPTGKPRNKNAAIPTNLSLTKEARTMATKLKKAMCRPSISNVVETLILEKATAHGLKLPATV